MELVLFPLIQEYHPIEFFLPATHSKIPYNEIKTLVTFSHTRTLNTISNHKTQFIISPFLFHTDRSAYSVVKSVCIMPATEGVCLLGSCAM
jgi:hypothetical protein